jgi:hypothetical protein
MVAIFGGKMANLGQFSVEKVGDFLKKQCYDYFCARTAVYRVKNANLKNHEIGPSLQICTQGTTKARSFYNRQIFLLICETVSNLFTAFLKSLSQSTRTTAYFQSHVGNTAGPVFRNQSQIFDGVNSMCDLMP